MNKLFIGLMALTSFTPVFANTAPEIAQQTQMKNAVRGTLKPFEQGNSNNNYTIMIPQQVGVKSIASGEINSFDKSNSSVNYKLVIPQEVEMKNAVC